MVLDTSWIGNKCKYKSVLPTAKLTTDLIFSLSNIYNIESAVIWWFYYCMAVNQAFNKGTWWMPWHWTAMKDVLRCDKLRGVAKILWSVDVRMGKPGWLKTSRRKTETRRTGTSKYPEEEKTTVIPQVVASERGEAQTRQVKACRGL